MKVALVTTPPSVQSGIGDYTRHWLEHFVELADVEVFVERGKHGETLCGLPTRAVDELDPARFDRVVHQLGNEIAHGFMSSSIERVGGTVVLHDWVLFDQAVAATPELAHGGWVGHRAALREGGLADARVYAINRAKARSARRKGMGDLASHGTLLAGWHELERDGRWTARRAYARLPGRAVDALRLRAISEPGRTLIVSRGGRALARVRFEPARREQQVELSLAQACDPLIALETVGVRRSDEQLRNGDARELGVFVRAIEVRDGERWSELDLSAEPVERGFGVTLDLDRFRLPFNRRVVRAADGFLVHSNFVARKLLAIRDAPVGVVHHGARPRWSDDDRRAERARLGLPERFQRGFLITNFGHVQRHKRVDKLLEALALARRERGDVHAAIVGTLQPQFFDARAFARGLGLDDAVLFTDYQPEEIAWRWIHAGDVAVQLRGPSTGGTSGGVFQSLSLGRAVIASALDEQRELPDSCVLKVSTDDREVGDLARTLIGLRDDPARRDELERAARAFVETECSWQRVARRYHELLQVQPRVRGR